MKLNAFHLPALSKPPVTSWSYAGQEGVELRVAQITPDLLTRQIDALLAARAAHLSQRPVLDIVRVIGGVAERFLDPDDELRHNAVTAVARVTGLAIPMAERIIGGMASDWREEALTRMLEREFADPRVLDGYVRRTAGGVRSHAIGPSLTFHVFSGNVPGVSVTSLIRSLLVKSATLGKSAAGEPILPALFAQAIADVDPELGACVAVTYWSGGDEALEACALGRAGAVVAYGGRAAVASLRERTPDGVPFLAYGHRVSFGMIAREALTSERALDLAGQAALAVATFDQQGCVSPHLFYVEEGGQVSAGEWAEMLAAGMERLEKHLPRGTLAPGESVAIRQARSHAEFEGLAGRGHRLLASTAGTAWTVIVEPDPAFAASCLNRLVRVKPVGSLESVLPHIAPLSGVLQTVGLEGPEARTTELAIALGRLGASRISSFERMPWPPADWNHDGRPPISDLVRWCDWE
ncbi:MAG: acyl-CoA reductase [Gemmatimonadota bacterium]